MLPTRIPENGVSYAVPNSLCIPIENAYELLQNDLQCEENAVNEFLDKNNIKLSQNQFDVLVSFTHQYGVKWWNIEPEKKLPEFIRKGNGNYNADDVRSVFALHDNPERRAEEAEVFINGY